MIVNIQVSLGTNKIVSRFRTSKSLIKCTKIGGDFKRRTSKMTGKLYSVNNTYFSISSREVSLTVGHFSSP